MVSSPVAPDWSKGAIVAADPDDPLASIIVFQYNPFNVRRDLQPTTSGGGARTEALRLEGAPEENIQMRVEIDAADQLESGDEDAQLMGIYPQLSALEMLLYPKSKWVTETTNRLQQGEMEIISPEAPSTFLVWGNRRVLPVRLTSLSITEQMYDSNLNPILAEVSLGLRVLSYNDLLPAHPSYALFMAHQVEKEAMAVKRSAVRRSVRNATGLPSGTPGLS
jgi:hypothetical protein